MANFLGQLGRGLANAGEAAVKASPYALNALMQKRAQDEQDRQEALRELYQRNADNRAGMASSLAQSQGLSNIALTNARTRAAENPKESVKYIQDADGNYVAMPTSYTATPGGPMAGPQVTPSAGQTPPQGPQGPQITPIATGVKAPAKTAPHIDPLSPQGVAAGATLADKKAAATAKYRPAPQQPGVFVGDPNNPNAAPVYTPRDQAFGAPKPVAAGAGGGQSLSPDDRQKMLAQARLDNDTMKAYEAKVLTGKSKVGAVKGISGAMAQGGGGLAGNIASIVGNTAVGAMDPEYQKYITAQRSYGRIMGNLQSKRYTDHQAEIERSISGLQGNDLNGTISYKQQLRDASLADVATPGAPVSHGGGRGGGGNTGNIDLRDAPTPKGAKKGNDYGIFGKPSGGDDE